MSFIETKFFLPFEVDKSHFEISIKDKTCLLGSCFTNNIGQLLKEHKFKVLINPAGTIYNPISIFKLIRTALAQKIDTNLILENEGVYYHWDGHSAISGISEKELIINYQKVLDELKQWISTASTMILSPGTCWVYRLKETNSIVANCHKVAQDRFTKSLLSSEEIVADYKETLKEVRRLNPDLQVILTISPVRHIRDGLVQNNLSKSILIQTMYKIVEEDSRASYFPSYEIMIDVLRDYRFYKEDMIHPNQQAINYIWKKFTKTYLDSETRDILTKWEQVARSLAHKPKHPNSNAHRKFLESTQKQLMELKGLVDVDKEINSINRLLENK